jgi:hypothetical protein
MCCLLQYLGIVFIILIYGIQLAFFPLEKFAHLNKLEGPEKMQLTVSMRTEVAIRLLSLTTGVEFWTEIVVQSQSDDWQEWSLGALFCTMVFFLNCAHAVISVLYFSVKKMGKRSFIGGDVATFILRSTVAMVVFDTTDVFTTLLFGDEEGPPSKIAIMNALISAGAAIYGLVGRKRDLMAIRSTKQAAASAGDETKIEVDDDGGDDEDD